MNIKKLVVFLDLLGLSILLQIVALISPLTSSPPAWTEGLRTERRTRKERSIPVVDARYSPHFDHLSEVGLLLPLTRSVAWFYSGYFCVMKTITHARSIFNGKRLSCSSPTPDPVNLVDTQRLVETIHRFLADQEDTSRTIHVYGGDFRHWFHQIPIPEWMRNLFGLRIRTKSGLQDYTWNALPMGWSWSPVIAQAVAWGFLTYREDNEDVFFDDDAFKGNRLPTWIAVVDPRTGRKCGIATVYYDNFLIICDDGNLLARIQARIKLNCKT